MEIALAAGVVKKVGQIAVQLVLNGVSIASNFTEEFQLLKDRIEEINCVLNEADEESSTQQESAKKWLHRVRDIAWEAEDILEECAVDSMYANNSHSCSLSWRELILRHRMGRRIEEVKAKLISVVEAGNNLNIVRAAVPHREEAAESSSRSQSRKWSVLPGDSKPVGIQYKIDSIVSLLENPQFPIIAVVGMGGIGKTYLLQHVYNGRKDRYEKSVWLSISQFYSIPKLLNDLAFQLDKDLSKEIKESGITEVLAAEWIHRFMVEKRCLVVLDDVWRATKEGNLIKKLGIPIGGDNHCKILVSTRNREVAVKLKAEIYNMECLTDEESWRLFCAHAFPKSEGNRAPGNLEEVACNMVEECGNLPLAIKTTAASLESKTELNEWQSKLSMLKKVSTSNDHVTDVLKLSYDSLPAHLKSCFAYFAFFPEDEEIECEYLMYLWMGEGFIPTGEDPLNCLDQLASLCMVEVWEDVTEAPVLYEKRGLHKYCKIHDLLLDLAIFISRENKGAFSLVDAFPKRQSVNTGGVRCRLFLAKKDIDDDVISERRPAFPSLVRTLTLSRNSNLFNIPAMLFNGMRVLRVLDLSYTRISTLPASVGGMKLLKVLNLTETGIAKVPRCVRSLKSLCYLNVSDCTEAPKWIGELRCLEHLEGAFERLPRGISKLESLRTLRPSLYLLLSKGTGMQRGVLRIEDIGKMSELQEIRFIVDDESVLRRMEKGILAPLNNKMRRLTVWNWIPGRVFPESMSAMRDLEHLSLEGFAVPSWICCFANLSYLRLSSECHCSEWPEFQEMPNLVSLELSGNKRCREMPKAFGKSGGFPRLRFLRIACFSELEEFPEMEDGAMACLEKLEIRSCRNLRRVGEGLERLKRLKEIKFEGSGTNEVKETLKEGGLYWRKIKDNNPQTTIMSGG